MIVQPNFFVIGVAKGGTTSLHRYLSQHPEVYLTPIKETNHFAAADIDEERLQPVYKRDVGLDIERYIARGMERPVHIAHVREKAHYQALYSKVRSEKAIGEVSNSYAICPSAVPTIHRTHPRARILIMLRNPVERAWSHYLMNLRESKVVYGDFISEVNSDHQASEKGWGVSHQYLELGLYSDQLARVYQYFPKEQVHWMCYEDFRKDPQRVLKGICRFLEVDPEMPFDLSRKANKAGVPRHAMVNRLLVRSGLMHRLKSVATSAQKDWVKSALFKGGDALPIMSASERTFIHAFYRTEIEQLSMLLHTDLSAYWNMA